MIALLHLPEPKNLGCSAAEISELGVTQYRYAVRIRKTERTERERKKPKIGPSASIVIQAQTGDRGTNGTA